MSGDPGAVKPQELINSGMIKSLSMVDFSPDQRMVEAALGQNTQQGGNCEHARVPFGTSQSGRSGSPLPKWQFPPKPV